MRVYDLILKKRNGSALNKAEIDFLINGYVQGKIPDYQMSALMMAIYFKDMNEEETLNLTGAMVNSGDTIDLSAIPGVKVDKHSTGGVGDTTTIVLAPLVAAAGAPVAKLSGRGLGHTGGTLDKLESIPGFKTEMSLDDLVAAVSQIGVAVAGQTGNLVPADKLLYALRDVTATVDSMPLIAGSIMSKKLASGADALVLDVKTGDGAFLKDREAAFELARMMVAIGNRAGRKTVAVVTNMDQPLGAAVGNALEVKEAIETLKGEGPPDLEELCLTLGGWMLTLAGKCAHPDQGRDLLMKTIASGSALEKFKEMVRQQHGNDAVAEDLSLLPQAGKVVAVKAPSGGYVQRLEAEAIGLAAMSLGAGRENKDSVIDPAVGIMLNKKIGDPVQVGESLATIHASVDAQAELLNSVQKMVIEAYELQDVMVEKEELILGVVE
ncbi:MAG: pyrimidine-nucleoside phosphorylase [Firmicutes bacterium]|nr:pyrimidine-nucleoside phosphorylase [Bacillota bacterium]